MTAAFATSSSATRVTSFAALAARSPSRMGISCIIGSSPGSSSGWSGGPSLAEFLPPNKPPIRASLAGPAPTVDRRGVWSKVPSRRG